MRILLSLLALLSVAGCIHNPPTFATPAPYDPSAHVPYPLEIQFNLLGPATAVVCMENAFRARPEEQFDELHPQARYKAIESVPGADNIMYERSKIVRTPEQVCMTVSGHAYAIKSLHARPGPEAVAGAPGILMKVP
jgi:hypothetical protein